MVLICSTGIAVELGSGVNFVNVVLLLLVGVALSHIGFLGGGDSKLLAAYAIAIIPENIPLTLFAIAIVGGLVSVFYFIKNKFTNKPSEGVPYGI